MKNKAQKNATPLSQKQKTEKASKKDSTAKTEEHEDIIKKVMAMMAPMAEFHEPVADADSKDVRIFWDIRLVKGASTKMAGTTGSASLPGLLTDGQLRNASTIIQDEIAQKIAGPLAYKFQREAEAQSGQELGDMQFDTIPDKAKTKDDVEENLDAQAMESGEDSSEQYEEDEEESDNQ